MRRFVVFMPIIIIFFMLNSLALNAQEDGIPCLGVATATNDIVGDQAIECVRLFFSRDTQVRDGNFYYIWFDGSDLCHPNTLCIIQIEPVDFNITSDNVCGSFGFGIPTEYARERFPEPYQSITCSDESDEFWAEIAVVDDEYALVITILNISEFYDPLDTLNQILGDNRDALLADSDEITSDDTQSGVDLSACSGLDETADAQCLADLALENDDYDLCFAALDVYACGANLLEQIEDPCTDVSEDDAIGCYITFATDTGIEAACEQLPLKAQGTCFLFALSTSGDISMVERRFPNEAEQDTAYTTMAVIRRDPTYIEFIDDNERYDSARIMMVIPAIADGEALENNYCDGLRGNYDSEYPEDADRNREQCQQFVGLSQEMAVIEDDAEKLDLMAQVLREVGTLEADELADLAEQGAQAIRDDDIESLEDAFGQILGGE